jgi:hypothetical protein
MVINREPEYAQIVQKEMVLIREPKPIQIVQNGTLSNKHANRAKWNVFIQGALIGSNLAKSDCFYQETSKSSKRAK